MEVDRRILQSRETRRRVVSIAAPEMAEIAYQFFLAAG
jgi:hypothetical protein